MQAEFRRALLLPFHYWRTILLVLIVGMLVATIFQDATAVLFSTFACAFAFNSYERRRWIVMPTDARAGDIVLRLSLALAVTFFACRTQLILPVP
jgi:hypothetical protein